MSFMYHIDGEYLEQMGGGGSWVYFPYCPGADTGGSI